MPLFNPPGITGGPLVAGQIPFTTAASHRSYPDVVGGNSDFWWQESTERLGVGLNAATPIAKVQIAGDAAPAAWPLALQVKDGPVHLGNTALSTYASEAIDGFELTPPAGTSRARTLRVAGGALTSLSGGEIQDIVLTPRSVEFGTGTILATQRGVALGAPTYSATSAKTLTVAATLYVPAPAAGSNVTFGSGTDYYTGGFAAYINGPVHIAGVDATTGPSSAKKPAALLSLCRASLTAVSAGYEYRDLTLNCGNTIQWDTAGPTTWRGCVLNDVGTTLASTAGTTISDAASVYIADGPTAGSNMTLTRRFALWVDAGPVRFDETLVVGATGLSYAGPAAHFAVSGANDVITMRQNTTTSYSSIVAIDNSGTAKTGFGYGNASAGDAARASAAFIWLNSGVSFKISDGGGGVLFSVAQANGNTSIAKNTSSTIGFYGAAGAAKGAVTGSRGGNAALASLLTYLASLGLLTDSSS